jgi:F-type H+-transporting ATPase subunit b
MLIDWFTVVAQLINFAILLVALKFLLYDRIVKAMEDRRRSIHEERSAAQERERAADEKIDEVERERRELESRRAGILAEAREQAEERRRELLAEVERDVDEQERKWKENIWSRQNQLLGELTAKTGQRAVQISRQALADLADTELESEVVRRFLESVDDIEDDEDLSRVLAADEEALTVTTAFELGDEERRRVRERVRELVADSDREVEWKVDPALIAGIIVRAGAHEFGWAIDGYLDGLREEVARVLREQIGSDDVPGAQTDEGKHHASEGDGETTVSDDHAVDDENTPTLSEQGEQS